MIDKLFPIAACAKKVGRARIVAGLEHKGRLVAIASNSYKTHPITKKISKNEDKICLHAEIACILNARRIIGEKKLRDSTLYVVRAKYDGDKMVAGCAKPCAICQTLIDEFRIKVVHT